ncbi:MAG: DUF4340 domain-containing protein [Verrucomicrobiota bacterium]
MRSVAFTFLLAIATAFACGLASWQWHQGNFDTLFGAPPTPVGERIYDSFKPDQVKHIRVSTNGVNASFSLTKDGWQASSPWIDRMDPRAAVAIINFTLSLRVEDHANGDEIDLSKAGLNDGAVNIRLESADHTPLAKYNLGRVTPWKAEVDGLEQPAPTVFIQPRDKSHKRYIYSCAGDITSLFKDGLKFLRDHHPFYFNPITLKFIRIRSQQGDLTLGRDTAKSPWRIIKPIDLSTDPTAAKTLLEGLFELQAVKVSDRLESAPQPNDKVVKNLQIGLMSFDSETETQLDISPIESPEAQVMKATVSNRPGTVFDLPVKPEPGIISLANLPLSVNELRDPSLTHLHIPSLRGVSIQPATGPEIIISRVPEKPWMVEINHETSEANEENLYALLKAVTTGRATGFVSDAATDFTPWGLDRPMLKLRFIATDDKVLELRFGMDAKGGCFVNRQGTPTVMRVDPSLVATISVRPYEWRHARLWSVDRTNLVSIERRLSGKPSLFLKYTSFNDDTWKAESEGRDLTGSLDPMRVNYMFSIIEGLKVARWLSSTDEAASAALLNPSLTLAVMEKTRDDELNFTVINTRTIIFAPATKDANPSFYFGRLNTDIQPFLISRDIYQKLAIELFDK